MESRTTQSTIKQGNSLGELNDICRLLAGSFDVLAKRYDCFDEPGDNTFTVPIPSQNNNHSAFREKRGD
jgi:hypothetical protein